MDEINEIAELASDWWVKQIINPEFDNGDASFEGFMASYFSKQLVEPLTEDQIMGFKDDLKLFILNRLSKVDKYLGVMQYEYEYRTFTDLSTDYAPTTFLHEIAKQNNIKDTNFPIKTTMWVSRNYLAVKGGYTAGINILYANSKYYEDKIKSYEDSIKEMKEQNDEEWNKIHSFPKNEIIEEQQKVLESLNKEYEVIKKNGPKGLARLS